VSFIDCVLKFISALYTRFVWFVSKGRNYFSVVVVIKLPKYRITNNGHMDKTFMYPNTIWRLLAEFLLLQYLLEKCGADVNTKDEVSEFD
jgi:hypothetical protein